jgi:hypothetical protein
MASIDTRLGQIEKQLGEAGCICTEPENSQLALVVIGKNWGPEQIEFADASARFICPTHGDRSQPILRLSESDARL